MNYERQFLQHLDLIDQIVRTSGRRRHFSPAEQDDLQGFVRLRLIEDDYAILQKFQGRSSFHTYLISVIERLTLDFLIAGRGRWRPSASAQREGEVAILLERYVVRDGRSYEEAVQALRSSHNVKLSDRQLLDLWDKLPRRTRTTEVVESAALGVPSPERAESRVDDATRQAQINRVEQILKQTIERFSVQDRVLLGLRFQQELKIAQIAAVLGSSSPTLHRRLAKLLGDLREALKSAGVNPADIPELIGDKSVFFSPLLRKELERFSGAVRLFRREE